MTQGTMSAANSLDFDHIADMRSQQTFVQYQFIGSFWVRGFGRGFYSKSTIGT